jgi:hypothetical protein
MKARYLALYKETTPAVFPTSPTPIYPRLPGDSAWDAEDGEPQTFDVRTADATNRLIDEESSRRTLKGKLSTYLYPEQAQAILEWATTVQGDGELPSYASRYFDGLSYYENLGWYVEQLQLAAQPASDEGIFKVSLDLVGVKAGTKPTISTFPQPLQSVYPTTNPYKFTETAGGLILVDSGTTARVKYNSLTLTVKNMMSPNFDEGAYVSDVTYHGRDVSLVAAIRYTSATERDWFMNRTNLKASLVLTKGTKVLTLDCQGRNKISQRQRTQPLNAPMYQTLTLKSLVDPSNDKDFSFTYVSS